MCELLRGEKLLSLEIVLKLEGHVEGGAAGACKR